MLQRALDNTAWRLSIFAHIVVTPGLLKLTLALSFPLDHCYNLGTGIHHFGIDKHTSVTRKVLKARTYQHQVVSGGGAAPSLADAETLMAPDGVSLPATLAMARRDHVWMIVVLVNLFGLDHPTTMSMN